MPYNETTIPYVANGLQSWVCSSSGTRQSRLRQHKLNLSVSNDHLGYTSLGLLFTLIKDRNLGLAFLVLAEITKPRKPDALGNVPTSLENNLFIWYVTEQKYPHTPL